MSPQGPPQGAPAPTPPPGPLPERMKANRALAGKTCPACEQEIRLGADAWNCPSCRTPHHAACRDAAQGCAAEGCPSVAAPAGAPAETKPCPYCGEPVLKEAKKCKHCHEILSASLRAARERKAKGDPNLGRSAMLYGIGGLLICAPILGPIAIIKGREALKNGVQTGMATTGIVFGIVDILLFVVVVLARLSQ